jgi:hypothetical protein
MPIFAKVFCVHKWLDIPELNVLSGDEDATAYRQRDLSVQSFFRQSGTR